MPLLKIYGERNTGTNYLTKLIRLNLSVVQLPGTIPKWVRSLQNRLPGSEWVRDVYFFGAYPRNLGWKHAAARAPDKLKNCLPGGPICFLTLTKNPYAWLLSLHRMPYHQKNSSAGDFQTFLKTPWETVRRENAPRKLSSPVALWNLKNRSYLKLKAAAPTLNIRYEDLLENPAAVLGEISQTFSLGWKSSSFVNYEQPAKAHAKNNAFYRDYYLNEKWRAGLSPASVKLINRQLDAEVMQAFNYEWVEAW